MVIKSLNSKSVFFPQNGRFHARYNLPHKKTKEGAGSRGGPLIGLAAHNISGAAQL